MKIGLVLSGGGGKGAYELGVWKALKELNLNKYISVFSGTFEIEERDIEEIL